MSIRKRRQSRDVPVRMGPGEFVDPRDTPGAIAWKRVLDVAAEEIPEFLPSLINDDTASWVDRWHLPAEGYAGKIIAEFAEDTRDHYRLRALEGYEPDPGFTLNGGKLRPHLGYYGGWRLGEQMHRTPIDPHGVDLAPLMRDTEGLSVLHWNPFHETRRDAEKRLRDYLDKVLDEIERQPVRYVSPHYTGSDHMRTPALPRRHIAWFVRWKLGDRESIYGIAKRARVSENAVRHALDKVADVLQWGYRNDDTGGK